MRKGWFEIEGVQRGDRTLAQQMKGLEVALAAAAGKRVLDLGCAEGLIAREFARAGAAEVHGIECNEESAAEASRQCVGLPCTFTCGHVGKQQPLPAGPWHVVLALAILHKLQDPGAVVKDIVASGPELVVVRLPGGSKGQFATKHYGTAFDVNAAFTEQAFRLEGAPLRGPNGELVQYWRPQLKWHR